MKKHEIKRVLNLLLITLITLSGLSAREITDMAGRKVNIPDDITAVLPHDEKTGILIYPVLTDMMIGRCINSHSNKMNNISNEYKALKDYDIRNHEDIIMARPDIILAGCFIPENYDRYDRLSAKLNIPFVVIDMNTMSIPATYDFLENLIGKTNERAKDCKHFLNDFFKDLEDMKAANKDKIPGVYLAMSEDGLKTAPSGSRHSQILDIMGITNIADTDIPTKGLASVSMEQIMMWKPEYIFTVTKEGKSSYGNICSSALWKDIPAVNNGKVYDICEDPYSWFGNPPSINIIPGMIMLSGMFYDMPQDVAKDKIKEFYNLFYGVDISHLNY